MDWNTRNKTKIKKRIKYNKIKLPVTTINLLSTFVYYLYIYIRKLMGWKDVSTYYK